MGTRFSFVWEVARVGNDGYVFESVPGTGYKFQFGPMPPNIVPAFAESRRRLIAMKMKALGVDYVDEDVLDKLTPFLTNTTKH